MRELTKIPNLMSSPASVGVDLRTMPMANRAQLVLGSRLEKAKAFARKVRPDMHVPVQRGNPSPALAMIAARALMRASDWGITGDKMAKEPAERFA